MTLRKLLEEAQRLHPSALDARLTVKGTMRLKENEPAEIFDAEVVGIEYASPEVVIEVREG